MQVNRVGFPCLTASLGLTTGHTLREASFTEEKVKSVIDSNINDLVKILNWMGNQNIRMFRLSSDFIPFASHKLMKDIDWYSYIEPRMKQIGNHFTKNNFRFSIHAMPFVVLNSPKRYVVENSINEMFYYLKLLYSMGLDESHKIVIHTGGVYGDKPSAVQRLIDIIKKFPPELVNRCMLENDDKQYNYNEILEICKKTGMVPLFDIHHFYCLPSTQIHKNLKDGEKLWKGIVPKIHASSYKEGSRKGTHDSYINEQMLKRITKIIPYDAVDIMFECGEKELATKKAIEYFVENSFM